MESERERWVWLECRGQHLGKPKSPADIRSRSLASSHDGSRHPGLVGGSAPSSPSQNQGRMDGRGAMPAPFGQRHFSALFSFAGHSGLFGSWTCSLWPMNPARRTNACHRGPGPPIPSAHSPEQTTPGPYVAQSSLCPCTRSRGHCRDSAEAAGDSHPAAGPTLLAPHTRSSEFPTMQVGVRSSQAAPSPRKLTRCEASGARGRKGIPGLAPAA